jgi:hypothetical protein
LANYFSWASAFLITGILLLGVEPVRAVDYVYRTGIFTGPYLPYDVPGITEIMKPVGLSLSAREVDGFGVEGSVIHSTEAGAAINIFTGGLTLEMPIPQVDFMKVLVSVGIQTIYYRAMQQDGVPAPYSFSGGIFMGGGFSMELSPSVEFRSQVVLINGPGRAALVEFGIEIPLGGAPISKNRDQSRL